MLMASGTEMTIKNIWPWFFPYVFIFFTFLARLAIFQSVREFRRSARGMRRWIKWKKRRFTQLEKKKKKKTRCSAHTHTPQNNKKRRLEGKQKKGRKIIKETPFGIFQVFLFLSLSLSLSLGIRGAQHIHWELTCTYKPPAGLWCRYDDP
jgi:hypothetical protein